MYDELEDDEDEPTPVEVKLFGFFAIVLVMSPFILLMGF